MKKVFGILAFVWASIAGGTTAAQASVELCNRTGELLQIAYAHPITVPYVTNEITGWLQLRARSCETVIVGDVGVSYPMYYFIVKQDFTVYEPEGVAAEYPFCVTSDAFKRRGSWRKLQEDCPSGWLVRNFYLHTIPPGDLTLNIYN